MKFVIMLINSFVLIMNTVKVLKSFMKNVKHVQQMQNVWRTQNEEIPRLMKLTAEDGIGRQSVKM